MIFTYDDWIGFTGTISLTSAYFMSNNGYNKYKELLWQDFLNIYGSLSVGFNCIIKKTYPPLLLEILWLFVAFQSLYKNYNLYNNRNNIIDNIKIMDTPYYQTI